MSAHGRFVVLLVLVTTCSAHLAHAQSGERECGNPFTSWFGPFDYRSAPKGALNNVETNHFTPLVEQMIRGVTTGPKDMGKDVAYVLGVFPNHHRALLTMMRMGEKDQTERPRGVDRPVECWFDRAVRFARDDTISRLIYAEYLRKKGRMAEALSQTQQAETFAKDNPFTHFNVGISYFELGEYTRATTSALRARELGLNRPELVDMLKRANQWVEPQE